MTTTRAPTVEGAAASACHDEFRRCHTIVSGRGGRHERGRASGASRRTVHERYYKSLVRLRRTITVKTFHRHAHRRDRQSRFRAPAWIAAVERVQRSRRSSSAACPRRHSIDRACRPRARERAAPRRPRRPRDRVGRRRNGERSRRLAWKHDGARADPAGSGNGLAAALAVPAIRGGHRRRARRSNARRRRRHAEHRPFFNVAGIGFDARSRSLFNQRRRGRRGTFPYVDRRPRRLPLYRQGIPHRRARQASRADLDHRCAPCSSRLPMEANTGMGMQIAPNAELDDGLLEACIVVDRPSCRGSCTLGTWRKERLDRAPRVTSASRVRQRPPSGRDRVSPRRRAWRSPPTARDRDEAGGATGERLCEGVERGRAGRRREIARDHGHLVVKSSTPIPNEESAGRQFDLVIVPADTLRRAKNLLIASDARRNGTPSPASRPPA